MQNELDNFIEPSHDAIVRPQPLHSSQESQSIRNYTHPFSVPFHPADSSFPQNIERALQTRHGQQPLQAVVNARIRFNTRPQIRRGMFQASRQALNSYQKGSYYSKYYDQKAVHIIQQISESIALLKSFPIEVERLRDASTAIVSLVDGQNKKKQRLSLEKKVFQQSYKQQQLRLEHIKQNSVDLHVSQKYLDEERQRVQQKQKQIALLQQQITQSSGKIENLSRLNKFLNDQVAQYKVRFDILQEKLNEAGQQLDKEQQINMELRDRNGIDKGHAFNKILQLERAKQQLIEIISQLNTQRSSYQSFINGLQFRMASVNAQKMDLIHHLNQVNGLLTSKHQQAENIRGQLAKVVQYVRQKQFQRRGKNRIEQVMTSAILPTQKHLGISAASSLAISPKKTPLTLNHAQSIKISPQYDDDYGQLTNIMEEEPSSLPGTRPIGVMDYGQSQIVQNQKNKYIYLGIMVQGEDGPFYTRNFVKVSPAFYNHIYSVFRELQNRPVDKSTRYSRIVDPSTQVFMLKDLYEGSIYYSLRHKRYYRGELYATKNGFNLRQNEMTDLIDNLFK